MATVVGVLLIVLILIGVPLKYLAADGTGPQHTGELITTYLGIAHGYLYMIFLVTAFLLFRLFDIWKPFPARESQALTGGVGVMVDDLIAGLYTLVLVMGARALFGVPA